MNASKIYLTGQGQVSLLKQDIPLPGEKEVQVRLVSSVVSPGTERAFILQLENAYCEFPVALGYSCSGIVENVGTGVTSFTPGDKVACVRVPHQSLANAPEFEFFKIPDGVGFDEAAFIFLGVIAIQAVRKARIELGEDVLVIGLGLVGQIAMQLARVNGAATIICIDKTQSKLTLAKKLGADVTISADEENWLDHVLSSTGGAGAPVVIESTGFPGPINNALLAARKFGRVILLGSTRGCTETNFYRDVHKKAINIIGAHISSNPDAESYPGYWTLRDDANAFMRFLQDRRVDVESLITEKRPVTEYKQIYNRVLNWDNDYITTLIDWR